MNENSCRCCLTCTHTLVRNRLRQHADAPTQRTACDVSNANAHMHTRTHYRHASSEPQLKAHFSGNCDNCVCCAARRPNGKRAMFYTVQCTKLRSTHKVCKREQTSAHRSHTRTRTNNALNLFIYLEFTSSLHAPRVRVRVRALAIVTSPICAGPLWQADPPTTTSSSASENAAWWHLAHC